MELDTFITETIKSIIRGVKDSHEFARENDALVNPYKDSFNIVKNNRELSITLTKIDFDIAVTASNEEKSNVNGGIKIQVLNLGASTANNITSQTSSRVKFELNVALPHQLKN